jgi:hypothetical protein
VSGYNQEGVVEKEGNLLRGTYLSVNKIGREK